VRGDHATQISFTAWRLARRSFAVALATLLLVTLLIGSARPAYAASSSFVQYTYSGSAGSRTYNVYTPAGYTTARPVPLIVMLHGCGGNPTDFSNTTQMNVLADGQQFVVVYPHQSTAYGECWQWTNPAHQSRGSGEPAIIAGITQTVLADTADWNIDPSRVYVTGFSAGAAMSVILGVTYPDIYAAIGESAGLEYKASTSGSSSPALQTGGPDAITQGQLAYTAMGPQARVVPVIVFQGTQDTVVYPINGDQVVRQWMETDRLASASGYNASFSTPSTTATGRAAVPSGQAYSVRTWNDLAGNEIEEYWSVTGMTHAWSGGSTTGAYADPYGPSATQLMYEFFMAHPFSGPPTAAPNAPTGLTATASSASQVNLSWTGSAGATSYQIQRSPDGTTGWTQAGTSSASSFNDIGLAPSTTYYYRVLASNAVGTSTPSNVSSATTMLGVTQAPQGTWVGAYGGDGYALLAWNGSSDLASLGPATLVLDQGTRWQWRTSSTAVRDLQSPDGSFRRAMCIYDVTQLRLHLNFASAYTGTLHLYALDGTTVDRREVVTVNDGSGPRSVTLGSAFDQGIWIHVPISVSAGGSVTITIDRKAGYNAVLSGIFLK